MKVILLQDVAKIGRRFDIVEVPDGYAMNKLVPQKAATPATPENVKRVRAQKDKRAEGAAGEAKHFDAMVTALEGKTVTITAPTNQDGGLFESLKPVRIAEALSKTAGLTVLEEYVSIEKPIKHTGEHAIVLEHGDQRVEINLIVEAEG